MDENANNVLFKTEIEDLAVEYECLPALPSIVSDKRQLINSRIDELDNKLDEVRDKVDELNADIERLTYNGDTGDLIMAVSSGVLCGILDAVFVGELGLFKNASKEAQDSFNKDIGKVHEKVNKFITKYAQINGYKGEKLEGAISFLEKKFPVAQDNAWWGQGISSASDHHLDDLAHHPTILGLISALVVQFFRIAVFADSDGKWHLKFVKPSKEDIIKIVIPVVISGFLYWIVNLAEQNIDNFDEKIPKPIRKIVMNLHKIPMLIPVLKTAINWFGHLVSDMGGSKNSAGDGAGIPGLFLSLLKELSMLPGIKDSNLPKILTDLYKHNKNSPLTKKLDLRAELAVVKEQCMPIIVNELLVRTGYFIRHLIIEAKNKSLKEIDWSKVIPLYNRTIVRMMTVASGTFTAFDLADAAAETAIRHPEACTSVPAFLGTMVMRVNFVGIGRFAIAVTTDVGMGIQRNREENERGILIQNLTQLTGAKAYYQIADAQLEMVNLYNSEIKMFEVEADMWNQVEYTKESICELYAKAFRVGNYYAKAIQEMNKKFEEIEEDIEEIRKKDPDFVKGMLERLE